MNSRLKLPYSVFLQLCAHSTLYLLLNKMRSFLYIWILGHRHRQIYKRESKESIPKSQILKNCFYFEIHSSINICMQLCLSLCVGTVFCSKKRLQFYLFFPFGCLCLPTSSPVITHCFPQPHLKDILPRESHWFLLDQDSRCLIALGEEFPRDPGSLSCFIYFTVS